MSGLEHLLEFDPAALVLTVVYSAISVVATVLSVAVARRKIAAQMREDVRAVVHDVALRYGIEIHGDVLRGRPDTNGADGDCGRGDSNSHQRSDGLGWSVQKSDGRTIYH